VFKEYLDDHIEDYDKILITDISDVEFLKNPFDLIGDDYRLYVGSNDTWGSKPLVKARYEGMIDDSNNDMPIYHAGTWGGRREIVRAVLKNMVYGLDWRLGYNINLAVFNLVVFQIKRHSPNLIYTGYPFTTEFKKYQKNTDAYIRHK
jgi:hypothetical protein